jgi:HNH endonuclease
LTPELEVLMHLNHTTQEIPYGYCKCGCGQKTNIANQTRTDRGWIRGEPKHFVAGHGNVVYGTLEAGFWANVIPGTPNECWFFKSATTGNKGVNYGRIKVRGKFYLAHRLSYELHNGPIPGDLFVCHRCDNPSCCNPSHLFLGTAGDNMLDKRAKGRGRGTFEEGWEGMHGECHPMAHLNDADVITIRQQFAQGERAEILWKKYGISKSAIYSILRRKSWSHIP